jgi:glyoxylase-like metal-dependent hydrolase (beta-lactamase superfamily II)
MENNYIHIHTPEITQVKVPLPFPLRFVNSYVIRGKDGVTVIDPGLHTEEAERVWDAALKELGLRMGDIVRIVLTHYHPDHYGLSGWMQEKSGASVYLSAMGLNMARRFWGEDQSMSKDLIELFRRHGLDEETLVSMYDHMGNFTPLVSPQPQVITLEPGQYVRLGDRDYLAILTPGHAEGHLCFYDETERVMFCGDHVLPKITPNVSYLPNCAEDNPLMSFMESLDQVSRFPVTKAYPGHRDPFETFAERTQEIIRHHHERLDKMRAALSTPKTAYMVCRETFGDKLSLHQLRFALAETIAHLVYLQKNGSVRWLEQSSGSIYFQAV